MKWFKSLFKCGKARPTQVTTKLSSEEINVLYAVLNDLERQKVALVRIEGAITGLLYGNAPLKKK